MERSKILKTLKEGRKSYFSSTIFPNFPPSIDDTWIITESGDRLDKMAFEFYKDTSYWWVLAEVNNIPKDSLYPEVGIQMRIPNSIQQYLDEFNKINNNR